MMQVVTDGFLAILYERHRIHPQIQRTIELNKDLARRRYNLGFLHRLHRHFQNPIAMWRQDHWADQYLHR